MFGRVVRNPCLQVSTPSGSYQSQLTAGIDAQKWGLALSSIPLGL